MRCFMRLVLVLSVSVIFGCSSISVSSDYDKSTDFNELKTFAWTPKMIEGIAESRGVSSLVQTRIQDAIATELAAKGYVEIVDGFSDFYVTYHVRAREKTEIQRMPGPMIGPGWGRGYAEVYQYEEGTLIIDLIHAKAQHLIWRGIGKGVVDWHASPERRTELIDEAVKKVLAQFPPQHS